MLGPLNQFSLLVSDPRGWLEFNPETLSVPAQDGGGGQTGLEISYVTGRINGTPVGDDSSGWGGSVLGSIPLEWKMIKIEDVQNQNLAETKIFNSHQLITMEDLIRIRHNYYYKAEVGKKTPLAFPRQEYNELLEVKKISVDSAKDSIEVDQVRIAEHRSKSSGIKGLKRTRSFSHALSPPIEATKDDLSTSPFHAGFHGDTIHFDPFVPSDTRLEPTFEKSASPFAVFGRSRELVLAVRHQLCIINSLSKFIC
ncbi:hypothetical protein WN55_09761 [Dufourea novaeangliae]|uniref:Uncharacterized protein n=1 Tax=Dufourea novaeangliae TaxID=178035 RepID=A0A154NZF4_DUFNO|nr:hypothetical protein WN55_09761 [Dufourea novaeangliae]